MTNTVGDDWTIGQEIGVIFDHVLRPAD